jgi:hypothetical protein
MTLGQNGMRSLQKQATLRRHLGKRILHHPLPFLKIPMAAPLRQAGLRKQRGRTISNAWSDGARSMWIRITSPDLLAMPHRRWKVTTRIPAEPRSIAGERGTFRSGALGEAAIANLCATSAMKRIQILGVGFVGLGYIENRAPPYTDVGSTILPRRTTPYPMTNTPTLTRKMAGEAKDPPAQNHYIEIKRLHRRQVQKLRWFLWSPIALQSLRHRWKKCNPCPGTHPLTLLLFPRQEESHACSASVRILCGGGESSAHSVRPSSTERSF